MFEAVVCVVAGFVMQARSWGVRLIKIRLVFVEVPMGTIVRVEETGFQSRL